ncbi:MAG: argininosuccinate lyase [bacterium]
MKKIWDKKGGVEVNKAVESYTVGIDYLLDLELLPYDIEGTRAQARMLHKIKILTSEELKKAEQGLDQILKLYNEGKFTIDKSQEDSSTAIEMYLTENFGDVGKKVHTGRSRNDQVITTTRLFMKENFSEFRKEVKNLVTVLEKQVKKYSKVKMPGYTHMQRAMPSSVGMWLGSYRDALVDDLVVLDAVAKIIDQNPLGSAAGYGENVLGLDRKFTASELGFKKVQENPMYCAMSRGKFENMVLGNLSLVVFGAGKLASDLLLFTTKEFNFFTLPDSFKTGSSIMPQKKNYDVLELVRGNTGLFYGYRDQVENVVRNLPAGYNRDTQLTKEPYLKGVKLALDTVKIMTLVVENLEVKKDNLEATCSAELYATDEALKLVKQGMSFREAYQQIKQKYA